jgi:hypothetical protein
VVGISPAAAGNIFLFVKIWAGSPTCPPGAWSTAP